MSEQLVLDLDAATLAARLADRRRVGDRGSAARLLMALVRAGLDERALPSAAGLVIELAAMASER